VYDEKNWREIKVGRGKSFQRSEGQDPSETRGGGTKSGVQTKSVVKVDKRWANYITTVEKGGAKGKPKKDEVLLGGRWEKMWLGELQRRKKIEVVMNPVKKESQERGGYSQVCHKKGC